LKDASQWGLSGNTQIATKLKTAKVPNQTLIPLHVNHWARTHVSRMPVDTNTLLRHNSMGRILGFDTSET
jgi:hypothetical protein